MPAPRIPYLVENPTYEEQERRGNEFCRSMAGRRSVRDFSDRSVPRALVERAIETANTAPSGAHQQPWTFVAVSDSRAKQQIRVAAEKEERAFYQERAPKSG